VIEFRRRCILRMCAGGDEQNCRRDKRQHHTQRSERHHPHRPQKTAPLRPACPQAPQKRILTRLPPLKFSNRSCSRSSPPSTTQSNERQPNTTRNRPTTNRRSRRPAPASRHS
jgi:hypothetical protein